MAEGGWLEVQHVGWVPWEELDDGAGRFNRARNAEDLLLQDGGFELGLFLPEDRAAAADFTCSFCLMIAKVPVRHNQRGCMAVFCKACVTEYIRYRDNTSPYEPPTCPRRCNNNPLIMGDTVTELPITRRVALLRLKMKCPHLGCATVISYSEFEDHIESCEPAAEVCEYCQVPIDNHDCKVYINDLREKLEQMTIKHQQAADRVVSLEQELCQARANRVQAQPAQRPQEQIAARPARMNNPRMFGAVGYSNHIRCRSDHRENVQLQCRFRDRTIQVEDMDLGDTGAELRARLQQEFGKDIGPILPATHTPIEDDRRLRQHQIGHKPLALIALEPGRLIRHEQRLNVIIGSNGPTI